MNKLVILSTLISFVGSVSADLLPSARRVDWSQVGIRAGTTIATDYVIPTNKPPTDGWTVFCCAGAVVSGSANVFDFTGVTNSLPALRDAISLAPSFSLIWLTNGTLRFTNDGGSALIGSKSKIAIRGAGMNTTKLLMEGSTKFDWQASANVKATNHLYFGPGESVIPLGTTNFSLLSGGGSNTTLPHSYIAVGRSLYLAVTNDWDVIDPAGDEGNGTTSEEMSNLDRVCHQIITILSVTDSTNITFWPPTEWAMTNTFTPLVFTPNTSGGFYDWVGLEHLTIIKTNRAASSEYGDKFIRVRNWWLFDVEISGGTISQLYPKDTLWGLISHCFFHDGGGAGYPTGGYGVEYHGANTGLRIEDNISIRMRSPHIVSGLTGSVLGYNYENDNFNNEANLNGNFTIHATYPKMNLLEGNVSSARLKADNTHGANGFNTWFRNWYFGKCDTQTPVANTSYKWGASINQKSLFNTVLNNVFLTPGATVSAYQSTNGNRSAGSKYVWDLGYANDGASSVTAVDANVEATLIRAGNYDFATDTVNWHGQTPETFPDSYYLSEKPDWFDKWGVTTFPPIGAYPLVTTNRLPAIKRYEDYILQGDYSFNPSTTSPTITSIADQSINQDTSTSALAFTIGDDATAVGDLTLDKSSSDTTLVPLSGIVFGGSGASRTVTVTPAAGLSGIAVITITVTDTDNNTASEPFTLTVNQTAVNTLPYLSDIGANATTINTPIEISFNAQDTETPADSLTFSIGTTDQSVAPNGAFAITGSGTNKTLSFSPLTWTLGTATVTNTVTDADGASTNDTFTITVLPNYNNKGRGKVQVKGKTFFK